jgi:hypothetical protein
MTATQPLLKVKLVWLAAGPLSDFNVLRHHPIHYVLHARRNVTDVRNAL